MHQPTSSPTITNRRDNSRPIVILGMLFFIFGFTTWLNGTLIPFLKLTCQLKSDIQAFFVTFSFYMAYFFLALPSSFILKKIGFRNGMALGLLIMSVGSLVFIPAAHSRNFSLFLCGLFVQAAGLTLLQTASNPYVSILGPMNSAARRISIMGICNKVAGVISPLVLGSIVLKGAGELENRVNAASGPHKEILLNELGSRIIMPYIIMALVLFALAWMIKASSLPEIDMDKEDASAGAAKTRSGVLGFPHLLLGVVCLFMAVGVEVMAGDAIGTYGRATGMGLDTTRYFTSFTLLAMLGGYLIGIFMIPRFISQQNSLKAAAIAGIVLTICVQLSHGYTAISFIALLGLANALMWPAIFPLAIDGLGRFTKTGSGLLIMGVAGGALIPLLYGSLKEKPAIGNSLAFFSTMLPCYVFILYYSIAGYKAGK